MAEQRRVGNQRPALAAPFDPEGSDYDYATARRYGLGPDETGHWPSRVPQTGMLLKGRGHETFDKTVKGEMDSGYKIIQFSGRYYSVPMKPSTGGR
jgi:hypothetical protein